MLTQYLEAAVRSPLAVLAMERVTALWPAAARLKWTEGRRSLLGLTWRNTHATCDVVVLGNY